MTHAMLAAIAIAPIAFAAPALAATETFHARLSTAHEVPPVTGPGRGEATATLDTATRQLTYTVRFHGLSGPATMAHIHGPAAPTENGGVQITLGGDNPTSPIKGTATLTASEASDLEAGRMYVNVHTSANPAGELRGQLMK